MHVGRRRGSKKKMSFRREKVPGFTACIYCALLVLFFISTGKFVSAQVTPIPSASWHDFVAECLSESGAEVTGECTTWASGNNYGTMPNWDTSLVEDMSGWSGSAHEGFGGRSTFDGDISKWNTGK